MTKHTTSLSDPRNVAATYAANFLHHYSFELNGYSLEELLTRWLDTYPAAWVRLAVIEALYQGRYKAVSVEQILMFWQRRDKPTHRFNHEFERLVSNKLPRNLAPDYKAEQLNYLTESHPPESHLPESHPPESHLPGSSLQIEDRSHQFLNTLKLLSTSTSFSEQKVEAIAQVQELSDSAETPEQPLSSYLESAEAPEELDKPLQAIAADSPPPSFQSDNYRKLVQLADFTSAQRRSNELSANAEPETSMKPGTDSEAAVSTEAIAIASDSNPDSGEGAIAEPELQSVGQPETDQNPLQVEVVLAPETTNPALTHLSKPAVESMDPTQMDPTQMDPTQMDPTQMDPTQELGSSDSQASIHQFVPASKISEFHSKLKAVAQLPLEESLEERLNQALQPSSTLTGGPAFTESD